RGAAALATSAARAGPAERIHPDRRGDRPHSRDRRVGRQARLRDARGLARRHQGRRKFFRGAISQHEHPADDRAGPGRLEIEITESMLLSKYGSATTILNALLDLGVTVALDDFGTGFSSLTYLRKLPFSRIKIDRSFISDMLTQPDCAAIVKSVIGLAR